jgi:hypothetical protein
VKGGRLQIVAMPKKKKLNPGGKKQNQKHQKKGAQQNQKNPKHGKGGKPSPANNKRNNKRGRAAAEGDGAELETFGEELRELLASEGAPVNMAQLPRKFKALFNKEVKAADFGFNKLRDLVATVDNVAVGNVEGMNSNVLFISLAEEEGGDEEEEEEEDAADEPPSKKQRKDKPAVLGRLGAAAAPPPPGTGTAVAVAPPFVSTASPVDPAQELRTLEQRKAKFGSLTDKQEARLAQLQRAAAAAAAVPGDTGAGTRANAGANHSTDAATAPSRKSALQRLGTKPPAVASSGGGGGGATSTDAARILAAASAEEVFTILGEPQTQQRGELGTLVAALTRCAALFEQAAPSHADQRIKGNRKFMSLNLELCAKIGQASASVVCDVTAAYAALEYPLEATLRENRLLRTLVEQIVRHARARGFSATQAAELAWSLASLRVQDLDRSLLKELADGAGTDRLCSLSGASVGRWLRAEAFFHSEKQPHYPLVRALLGESAQAFGQPITPLTAFLDVVEAYTVLSRAFEIEKGNAQDLASVTIFVSKLCHRCSELSADQLLRLLRHLQTFPPELFDTQDAQGRTREPPPPALLSELARVVASLGEAKQLPPRTLCDIAAAAAPLLYVDSSGSDQVLEAAAKLLEPALPQLTDDDLLGLCVTYVLPSVKGDRVWAEPIFNHAARTLLARNGKGLSGARAGELVRLGEELLKCSPRDGTLASIRDIAVAVARELRHLGEHGDARCVAGLEKKGWAPAPATAPVERIGSRDRPRSPLRPFPQRGASPPGGQPGGGLGREEWDRRAENRRDASPVRDWNNRRDERGVADRREQQMARPSLFSSRPPMTDGFGSNRGDPAFDHGRQNPRGGPSPDDRFGVHDRGRQHDMPGRGGGDRGPPGVMREQAHEPKLGTSSTKAPPACRYGDNCTRSACTFTHPRDQLEAACPSTRPSPQQLARPEHDPRRNGLPGRDVRRDDQARDDRAWDNRPQDGRRRDDIRSGGRGRDDASREGRDGNGRGDRGQDGGRRDDWSRDDRRDDWSRSGRRDDRGRDDRRDDRGRDDRRDDSRRDDRSRDDRDRNDRRGDRGVDKRAHDSRERGRGDGGHDERYGGRDRRDGSPRGSDRGSDMGRDDRQRDDRHRGDRRDDRRGRDRRDERREERQPDHVLSVKNLDTHISEAILFEAFASLASQGAVETVIIERDGRQVPTGRATVEFASGQVSANFWFQRPRIEAVVALRLPD